ncbi:pentapeptide repeat protein [Actinomadura pelletieri DSM 43383]|uniref:Pentapeptide repeat protein n=2 Tax=Actinomadura pelletieri TaxID=111805 RepID=A0A495QZT3_9ACTN|nr:pentapeptide repeat protein [Actinomadura pelletieri DSM 43383]
MTAVFWPRCSAVHGCAGRAVEGAGGCLAHLSSDEFERFLGSLRPGAEIDLRGVTVPPGLLDAVLRAVTSPDGRPHLGRARFDRAVLPSGAALRGVLVEGDTSFDGACFLGGASFYDARFHGNVSFRGVRFGRNVSFHGAWFHRHASFEEAVFIGDALFGEVGWDVDASFRRAVFLGAACFDRARFGRDAAMQAASFGGPVSFKRVQVARHARLERTKFRRDLWLGPLVAGGRIGLADATAHGCLRVRAAARQVIGRGAVVHGEADFRLRHAELDLEGAVFEGRVSVSSLPRPLQGLTEPPWAGAKDVPERAETGPENAAQTTRLTSLRRVDAARIELTDVDLSGCGFLGLRHPDALRITGDCAFATAPRRSWRRHGRGHAVLADDLPPAAGGPSHEDDDRLAALYGDLARVSADSGRGRLARDFRYSELEKRRHSETVPWRRWILHILWITCGYGLRAGRAIAWIAIIVALICSSATLLHDGSRHDAARILHMSGDHT